MSFVPLHNFENDFEIMNEHPFTIRNKRTQRDVKESVNKKGYFVVNLNGKSYLKHRIIALQFIPNPNNLPSVDHINHIRKDNRIENLCWKTIADNNKNKSSNKGVHYEFVDDIPEDAMQVDFYEMRTEKREFEEGRYYYYYNEELDEDIFYGKISDNIYKILHINIKRGGSKFVVLYDANNKYTSLYINRFKFQHDLL